MIGDFQKTLLLKLSQWWQGHVPHPPSPRKACLWGIPFVLQVRNGFLITCWAKSKGEHWLQHYDYSIMCTVDSDVMPRKEGVIWIIFNWWAWSKDFFLPPPPPPNWVPHRSFVTTQLIWRQTPKLCITVYWNKNSSSRHESRINIDRFPKRVPKFLGDPGACSPGKFFWF